MRSTSNKQNNLDNNLNNKEMLLEELSATDRIVLPLDFHSLEDAEKAIKKLKDHIGLFKVGLTLFVQEGWKVIDIIKKEVGEDKVFFDLKFNDIPETVENAASVVVAKSHVKFITVHASEGERALKGAVSALQNGTKVLAITVLTSITDAELQETGLNMTVKDRVLMLADFAKKAGCAGVVCSGREAGEVRRRFGKDFIVVTPGIRPKWAMIEGDDQRRIMTPGEAIKNGADYVVIGRPINNAPNPIDAAKRTADEIQKAIEELKNMPREVR